MVGDDGLIRVDCAFCSLSFPIALDEVLSAPGASNKSSES
jgi:hypothetical protein